MRAAHSKLPQCADAQNDPLYLDLRFTPSSMTARRLAPRSILPLPFGALNYARLRRKPLIVVSAARNDGLPCVL
jgi:hypothetical protein